MRVSDRCSCVKSQGECLGCKSGEHGAEHGDEWLVNSIQNVADSFT